MPSERSKEKYTFKHFLHDFIFVTAALPALVVFRPKWIYENKEFKRIKGGAVIIGNHKGFFDPMYMMIAVYYRRQRFLAMKEMFDTPFRRWLFSVFFCIPVDRDNVNIKTFRDVVALLKSGKAVTIFPEGHVSRDAMSSFKSGMVLMAKTADVPIVPIYVKPRKHWYSRLVMAIGEPINVNETYGNVSMSDMESIAEDIKQRELKLMQTCDRRKND